MKRKELTKKQQDTPPWVFKKKYPKYKSDLELPEKDWVSVGVPTVTKTGKVKMDNSKCDITRQVEIVNVETDERYQRIWKMASESGREGCLLSDLTTGFRLRSSVVVRRRIHNMNLLGFIVSREYISSVSIGTKYFLYEFAPKKTTLDEQRAERLQTLLFGAGVNGLTTKVLPGIFRAVSKQSHVLQHLVNAGDVVIAKGTCSHGRGVRLTYYHRDFAPQQKETV